MVTQWRLRRGAGSGDARHRNGKAAIGVIFIPWHFAEAGR